MKQVQVRGYRQLTDDHFYRNDSGKINAGLVWKFGAESHESYQFRNLTDLKRCIREYSLIQDIRQLQVVTYKIGEPGRKVLWFWRAGKEKPKGEKRCDSGR